MQSEKPRISKSASISRKRGSSSTLIPPTRKSREFNFNIVEKKTVNYSVFPKDIFCCFKSKRDKRILKEMKKIMNETGSETKKQIESKLRLMGHSLSYEINSTLSEDTMSNNSNNMSGYISDGSKTTDSNKSQSSITENKNSFYDNDVKSSYEIDKASWMDAAESVSIDDNVNQ